MSPPEKRFRLRACLARQAARCLLLALTPLSSLVAGDEEGVPPEYVAIDRVLCRVDDEIDLLTHVNPTQDSITSQEDAFFGALARGEEYDPQYLYIPVKFDVDGLCGQLNRLRIPQTPLGRMFFAKREELMRQIALVESRGKQTFTVRSEELYSRPPPSLVEQAYSILKKTLPCEQENKRITARLAKKMMEEYLSKQGISDWSVVLNGAMSADCMVQKARREIVLSSRASFSDSSLRRLQVHEIGTHVARWRRGKQMPYGVFARGLPGYLATEEGLAAHMEKEHGCFDTNRLRIYAGRVVAVHTALTSSFSRVFKELTALGFDNKQAYKMAQRAKRGLSDTSLQGGFTKDHVYLLGIELVDEFIRAGGDVNYLMGFGKIGVEDVVMVRELFGDTSAADGAR